jgi:lipopolysaccharide export system protein LptA
MRRGALLVCAAALAAACAAAGVRAEKADRDKPTQVEANRMTSDEARRVSIFEGNVVFTKGTLQLRAERVVLRQDADGFYHASASGAPVRFRQRSDPQQPGLDGVWVEGEALRVEIDERTERIELMESARIARDQDEVRGSYILYDQRSEFFSVSSAKGAPAAAAPGERVRAVIQPKQPAPAAKGAK